jgi:hypothetical protein
MNILHPTGETTAAIAAEIAQYVSDKLGGLEGEELEVYVAIAEYPQAWPPKELDDEHAEADSGGDVYVSSDQMQVKIEWQEDWPANARYVCRITQGIDNPAHDRRVMAGVWKRAGKGKVQS